MKAIFCLVLGIGLGIEAFLFTNDYLQKNNPALVSKLTTLPLKKERVLSAKIGEGITIIPTPTLTENDDEIIFDIVPPSSSPSPTISLTPVPTVVIRYTPTPTKKPSLTPPISVTPSLPITITLTITPSPLQINNTTSTPTPTKVILKTASSQEINGFVDRFAGQYSVDPNVIRHIALCESGFNPLSLSPNGQYAGLFQFSTGAWATYRGKIDEDNNSDLRFSAEESVQTAAYIISIGKGSIWPNCMP